MSNVTEQTVIPFPEARVITRGVVKDAAGNVTLAGLNFRFQPKEATRGKDGVKIIYPTLVDEYSIGEYVRWCDEQNAKTALHNFINQKSFALWKAYQNVDKWEHGMLAERMLIGRTSNPLTVATEAEAGYRKQLMLLKKEVAGTTVPDEQGVPRDTTYRRLELLKLWGDARAEMKRLLDEQTDKLSAEL